MDMSEKIHFKQLKAQKRQRIFDKHNGHCAYCGTGLGEIANMHMVHIVSPKAGGGKADENYLPCCVRCHNHRDNETVLKTAIAMRGTKIEGLITPRQALALSEAGIDLGLTLKPYLYEQAGEADKPARVPFYVSLKPAEEVD